MEYDEALRLLRGYPMHVSTLRLMLGLPNDAELYAHVFFHAADGTVILRGNAHERLTQWLELNRPQLMEVWNAALVAYSITGHAFSTIF